jgi:hypothetical protein
MPFDILDHRDKLTFDGGSQSRSQASYLCPICESPNLKITLSGAKMGYWDTYSCDCASTDAGKRKIRHFLSPAQNPNPEPTPTWQKPARASKSVVYTYDRLVDGQPEPIAQVKRSDDGRGTRKFSQSHWDGKRWVSGVPDEIKAQIHLYRIFDPLNQEAIATGAPLLIVEGEGKTDRLLGLGIPATCSIGGGGKWGHYGYQNYLQDLAGAVVVVCPDRDKPGIKHAEQVATDFPEAQWLYADPTSPEWETPPDNKGFDVGDWVESGATKEQILGAIEPRRVVAVESEVEALESGPVTPDTMAAAFAKFEGKQLNANSDPVKTEAKVLGINNYKLFRAYERHQDGFDVEWLIENLPLNSEVHKKAEKKYRRDNGLDGDGGGTVADRLISIAIDASVTYFQTDDKTVYAEVTTGSKLDTWPIDSTDFRDFLRRSIYERDSVTISADALTQAIATIGAINKNICPEKQIYVRAAKQDGAVYLSMSDRDCRAVKITAAGWEITQTYPVRFKAGAGVAIPDPVRGGSLELLRELCNFNFDTWVLMLTFLIQWLYSTKGYPILFLVAEANSGKTTIAEALKKLVDPSSVNIMPRVPDERDLAIHASRRRVILIDNVSRFDEAQSNNLCCIATGAGFSTRTLQSNDQETVLPLNNPMIFTGIADMASKGDLLSRGLTAKLQTPPPDKMMSQEAFADRFEAIRPGVSGALFDLLSQVLAVLPTVQGTYKGRERFGTFVELGLAIEQVLGWPVGTVLRVIGDGRESAHEATIEASPVGLALMDMMTGAEAWTGSATTLLNKLTGMVPENVARGKFWPSDATRLSRKLSELRASFAALGLEITSTKSSGARLVAIKRVPTAPTQTAILPVGTPIGPLELGDWDVPLEQVQEGDSYQFEYEPEGA